MKDKRKHTQKKSAKNHAYEPIWAKKKFRNNRNAQNEIST